MRKLILTLLFVFGFLAPAWCAGTYTESGVSVTLVDTGGFEGKRCKFFDGYTFTTQTVYNDVGSTSATNGKIAIGHYNDLKTILLDIDSLPSGGSFVLTVNGFVGTTTTSAILVSNTYNATGTAIIPLVVGSCAVYLDEVNVSGRATTSTASTIANIYGEFIRKK